MYGPTTDMIVALANARGGYGCVRTWFGALSDLSAPARPEVAIAMHLGLAPERRSFQIDTLRSVSIELAKDILVGVAVSGMAHPSGKKADPSLLKILDDGFAPLGADARCYSNGYWPRGDGWIALTKATFDSGVICHNRDIGFAFWVDEED